VFSLSESNCNVKESCVSNININFLRSKVQFVCKVGKMNVYAFIEPVDRPALFCQLSTTRLK